jgi:hypothetical protein
VSQPPNSLVVVAGGGSGGGGDNDDEVLVRVVGGMDGLEANMGIVVVVVTGWWICEGEAAE